MNRKQNAYRIISAIADEFIFDIDCGDDNLREKSKDELVALIYGRLIQGTRAQHFKFLTADWIKDTINNVIDRTCIKWGVELYNKE